MSNKHNDHVASCLCCKHLWFSLGTPDLSDITPGSPGYADCCKGHFDYGQGAIDSDVLEALHNTAPECPDFEPRD